jgi:hypothetical protein
MFVMLKDANFPAINDIGFLVPIVLVPRCHMNQQSTKSDIQQDLRDARALLEQNGSDDEKRKYRKAAEIILIKATRLDPENEEAKILLQSVRSVRAPSRSAQPQPQQPQQLPQSDDPSFTAPTLFTNQENEKKKSLSKVLFGLIGILVIGVGIIGMRGMSSSSAASSSVTRAPNVQQKALPAAPEPDTPAAQQPDAPATPVAAPLQTQQPVHTPDAAAIAAKADAPSPEAPTGKLAVTSSTPAEIYQGYKRLGLTPMTLQLPAGKQTLEYRLGDLRTVVTHDIKADKTTSATVTFQTTIQINAKPWAQVFVDGAPRRALGQTPLSGISVPVGSVLVFENPNFASKTHRVTETDTAIQMDFQ